MVTRRDWLKLTAAAGAALSVNPRALRAFENQEVMTRLIPGTNERVPLIGLGSSATFSRLASDGDTDPLKGVLSALIDGGGTVFDTAPSYGRGSAETVAGALAHELGIQDRIFWATKVNVAGRGGGSADPARARAQIEDSFDRFDVPVIDLIQVHNLGDPPTQLGIIDELKQEGRIRYTGITSTSKRRYGDLADVMRNHDV